MDGEEILCSAELNTIDAESRTVAPENASRALANVPAILLENFRCRGLCRL